ncbi:MAG: serine hydrolase [Maribacter sp.]
MFKNYKIIVFTLISIMISCGSQEKVGTRNPLEIVLASENQNIKRVIDSLSQHAVQIKFTQIDRKDGVISFQDYDFQVNATNYFYPASTVKFPIALLALAKLNSMENMDRNTRFYVEGDSSETTFSREIEKIFAVSDNQSYNRLFEFLGQDYINGELNRIQFGPIRISHRVSTPNSDEITTKPLIVYQNDSTTITLPNSINTSALPLTLKNIEKGVGYMDGDSLMQSPFNFGFKNYYPIETQHQLLKTVMFPKKYQANEKINLTKEQLDFVHSAMSTLPKNTGYDVETYYDGYCKFFMYGDMKSTIPEHIKIYNKVGDAYGTLTDCAYIQDTKNNVEFLLTATIQVNRNGIFNDNVYEYDDIGFPFLAELGRELYNYELKRKK